MKMFRSLDNAKAYLESVMAAAGYTLGTRLDALDPGEYIYRVTGAERDYVGNIRTQIAIAYVGTDHPPVGGLNQDIVTDDEDGEYPRKVITTTYIIGK